jgi:hypothetical protein
MATAEPTSNTVKAPPPASGATTQASTEPETPTPARPGCTWKSGPRRQRLGDHRFDILRPGRREPSHPWAPGRRLNGLGMAHASQFIPAGNAQRRANVVIKASVGSTGSGRIDADQDAGPASSVDSGPHPAEVFCEIVVNRIGLLGV